MVNFMTLNQIFGASSIINGTVPTYRYPNKPYSRYIGTAVD